MLSVIKKMHVKVNNIMLCLFTKDLSVKPDTICFMWIRLVRHSATLACKRVYSIIATLGAIVYRADCFHSVSFAAISDQSSYRLKLFCFWQLKSAVTLTARL